MPLICRDMGYSLRLERDAPLSPADLSPTDGFELEGPVVVARHGEDVHVIAQWGEQVSGEPFSDWHLAQLVRLATTLGAALVGEDGETYGIRDGIVEQVAESSSYEFGKLDEIIDAGPQAWPA